MLLSLLSRLFVWVLHADSPNLFPRPLSPEEELKCFQAMERHDPKARHQLIEHNLRLVAHIVKKYHGSEEQEELISIGTFGLIKAVDTFDYHKNNKFSTYASRCIENPIHMI